MLKLLSKFKLLSILALAAATILITQQTVSAQLCCNPPAWNFAYLDNLSGGRNGYYTPTGNPRVNPINFSQRTLALIVGGQSNQANYAGNLYTPTNTAVIDQVSILTGGQYPINGPMLGASLNPGAPGAISARVVDLLVTNNKFDRVFVFNVSVTNTTIAEWDSTLYTKICASIQRLAQYGITPTAPNVTFAINFGIGEADNNAGTSQAAQTASYASMIGKVHACGFPTTSRFFLRTESYVAGVTSTAVTNAQAATISGVTGVFQGANTDTLGILYRCGDDIHLADWSAAQCLSFGYPNVASTGLTAASTLDYNAMVATGAPF